ncbi:trimethylamine methyltransferase family protein [uncultured Desulfosarcina sp.]|uniref:trimethylamine methyltransferase family protein n=1 Tax=uncultured Desulfosarcina sp. TaxID=218289 RepID=UPI0029C75309|nr:trimethylamine methyltransferase family protein [uncultured Desulfosarcina sp.]
MNLEPNAFSPTLSFLSETDKKKIYHAALHVLERTGMTLQHDGAVQLLKDAGCRQDKDGLVTIPAVLVEKAVDSVPANIPMFNREGEHVMDLGGRRAYFGTGSDLMYHVDGKTLERTRTRLEHIERSARVCDALTNIDFIMSFAHPHDIDAHRAYLESFAAMAANSVKPIVNTADSRVDLSAMWEISKILRGGELQLREKPYWVQYDEPISPLKHPFKSIDKLIFCAETGMPVIYSPAPIAGSTAPMTVAGHVVQGLAECLFGLVVHQLTAPGAPFLMGMGAAVLDMATSQCSYNAPEYLMAYMGMVEMSHFFDIPNWGYAGTSDAQIPDGQATYEAGLLTYMSAAAGSNLNHDVGYLDFGLTGSLEMIVIMDEVIDQIRRIQKGIQVDDDHLAVEVIVQGGRQGQFLTHPHTLKHLRSTQWRPRLICRNGYERWSAEGRTSLLDRAHERLNQILKTHTATPVDEKMAGAIDALVTHFK